MPGRYAVGGVMKRGAAVVPKAAGAESASSTHGAFEVGDAGVAVVTALVTGQSGTTPTLLLTVEGSTDGQNWVQLGQIGANGYSVGTAGAAPSNITGAGTFVGVFVAPQFVRTRSTIGGTGSPSFTYSVTVEAGGG